MDEKLLEEIYILKAMLADDERIRRLDDLSKRLDEDEEVIALAYQKDLKALDYSDALNHYSRDDQNVKPFEKALFLAKYALDSHPLVKEYQAAYQKVRLLYEDINNILFGDFSLHACQKE